MYVAQFLAATLAFAATLSAFGQQRPSPAPTPLSALLAEAAQHNAGIAAADSAWRAALQVPRQAGTLPDPTFTYQQFSVGSAKPFAGYTNSDFSYIGIGASQEIPYPGKLRLRSQAAERAAAVTGAELGAARADVADAVKADDLQLAAQQDALAILRQSEQTLDQLIQSATAHYEAGQGQQADILQAQEERTSILGEITSREQQRSRVEADLKGLLHRDQASPDIVAEDLRESPLRTTAAELLAKVRGQNPQLQVDANSVAASSAALAAANREGKPDFGVAYMYQNTDRKFRDYYMFTFNVKLPRRARVQAETAEAAARLAGSRETLDAHLQQQLAQVQQAYVTAASDSELLTQYRQGLIPQSEAAYRSTLSAYAANREQFTHVLLRYVDVLNLQLEASGVLADHEMALAHLETLTGETLR